MFKIHVYQWTTLEWYSQFHSAFDCSSQLHFLDQATISQSATGENKPNDVYGSANMSPSILHRLQALELQFLQGENTLALSGEVDSDKKIHFYTQQKFHYNLNDTINNHKQEKVRKVRYLRRIGDLTPISKIKLLEEMKSAKHLNKLLNL